MLLAALVDLALDAGAKPVEIEARLEGVIGALALPDTSIRVEEVVERGIAARRVTVEDGGGAEFRRLSEIEALLAGVASELAPGVAERAGRAIGRLAEVEARIHGVSPEDIHFHELGAADTIVDVVGFFSLIHLLGVEEVVHGTIPVGSGRVECAHGRLGVPAPATLELLRGRPVTGGDEEYEATTPTGALLLAESASSWGPLPLMTVQARGYGAGSAAFLSGANVVRIIGGERLRLAQTEEGPAGGPGGRVVLLETVLDDVDGETAGYVVAGLLAQGALDAWLRPVVMKKSRPGVELCVLGRIEDEAGLTLTLIRETGTLGVRRRVVERAEVSRRWVQVGFREHEIPVKVGYLGTEIVSVKPEHEAAAAAAHATGEPLRHVLRVASEAAHSIIAGHAPSPGWSQSSKTTGC
jgi:hypothetical protein